MGVLHDEAEFKVGDRVRVVRHCNWRGNEIEMGVPIGEVSKIVRQTAQLAREGIDTFMLEGDDVYFYTPQNIEAAPSPIRAITRREVVPGDYGAVQLWSDMSATVGVLDASAAREAAHLFAQIAEVLEEQEAV